MLQPGAIREEFPERDDCIFLNHAGMAPWPRRTAEAVAVFARENHEQGSRDYPRWFAVESRLRARAATLMNAASADDIALLKNTSEGLSVVAYGLPWVAGDNVVTTDQEFPSNRIVWESLADQGVELRQAVIGDGTADQPADPEAALFARVDERTRLITVSSVQYASGLRMDLARIGAFCHENDIIFCVDAIQSVGALRFNVEAIRADAVVADGHKWMLGPEGVALFYTRPALRERLRLTQFGWHMVEALGDYDRRDWRIASGARRFECGSPNMLGIHALDASLSLLLEAGMAQVERGVLDNTGRLIDLITDSGHLELLSSSDETRRSGIVSFHRPWHASADVYRRLTGHGVQCALRAGGIRFSPHFHTSNRQLELAISLT